MCGRRSATARCGCSDRAHLDDIVARDRYRIGAGERVSFASYFNAFPASYWQQWTNVERVRLTSRRAARARCSSTVRPLRECRSAWHPSRSPTRWCTTSSCRSRRSATAVGTGSRSSQETARSSSAAAAGRRMPRSCVPAQPRSASPRSTSPTTACAPSTRSRPTPTRSRRRRPGVPRRPGQPAVRDEAGFAAVADALGDALTLDRAAEPRRLGRVRALDVRDPRRGRERLRHPARRRRHASSPRASPVRVRFARHATRPAHRRRRTCSTCSTARCCTRSPRPST